MNEKIPLLPGLTEICPAPDSLECWHPQDRPHPVPIANMTTVHLMHCTVWIERHKEALRMREEAQLFEFLMRHGGDMSETNAWHFDSEMGRVAQQTPDEWLAEYGPYVDMVEELDYRFGLTRVPKSEVPVVEEEVYKLMELTGVGRDKPALVMEWPGTGELVIDLTENEWAIRPLAIMRGLVPTMTYREMADWAKAS